MIRKIVNCDECGKEGEYNINFGLPTHWFELHIKKDGVEVISFPNKEHFCSWECLKKHINN